jgi:hypothetical protein
VAYGQDLGQETEANILAMACGRDLGQETEANMLKEQVQDD